MEDLLETVVIPKNYFEACKKIGIRGSDLLFEIIGEAFGDDAPNFNDTDKWQFSDEYEALYTAIAPAIIGSVHPIEPSFEVLKKVLGINGDDRNE